MDEQNDVIIESWDEWAPSGNGDQQDFLQPAQSVAPHRGVIYQVDCARRTLHHNATSRERVPLAKARSVTTLLLWTVRPEDDGSEVTCVASNPLIPHHGMFDSIRSTTMELHANWYNFSSFLLSYCHAH